MFHLFCVKPSHSFHVAKASCGAAWLFVFVKFFVGVLVFAWFCLVSPFCLCFFACLRSLTGAQRTDSSPASKKKFLWIYSLHCNLPDITPLNQDKILGCGKRDDTIEVTRLSVWNLKRALLQVNCGMPEWVNVILLTKAKHEQVPEKIYQDLFLRCNPCKLEMKLIVQECFTRLVSWILLNHFPKPTT